MRNDVKSNYILAEAIAATAYSAGATNSAVVDHANGSSASYLISVGDVGVAGTVDAKLQYSDDNSTWTDYPASDPMGNDDSITQLTAAGSAQLNVVNTRGRYSRCVVTVGTNACNLGVVSVLGPRRHVDVT